MDSGGWSPPESGRLVLQEGPVLQVLKTGLQRDSKRKHLCTIKKFLENANRRRRETPNGSPILRQNRWHDKCTNNPVWKQIELQYRKQFRSFLIYSQYKQPLRPLLQFRESSNVPYFYNKSADMRKKAMEQKGNKQRPKPTSWLDEVGSVVPA